MIKEVLIGATISAIMAFIIVSILPGEDAPIWGIFIICFIVKLVFALYRHHHTKGQ